MGTLNSKALGERGNFSCTTGRGITEEAEQSALISKIHEEGLCAAKGVLRVKNSAGKFLRPLLQYAIMCLWYDYTYLNDYVM